MYDGQWFSPLRKALSAFVTSTQEHVTGKVRLELYTDRKDPDAEQNVETALDAAGIFYNKTETWIDSEKLYEVLYTFEMEV